MLYLLSFSFSAFSLFASCAFSAIQRDTSSWLSSVVFLSFSSRAEKVICRASYSSFRVWFAFSRSWRDKHQCVTVFPDKSSTSNFQWRSQLENLRSAPCSTPSAWHSILIGSVGCQPSQSAGSSVHTVWCNILSFSSSWFQQCTTWSWWIQTGAAGSHMAVGEDYGEIRPFTANHWPSSLKCDADSRLTIVTSIQ